MIGVDIIQISRIEALYKKFGTTFAQRILSAAELGVNLTPQFLASRWATKEAFAKAVGSGLSDRCRLRDISILNDTNGKPYIKLNGVTSEFYKDKVFHISISHEVEYAVAVCICLPISS